MKQLFYKINLDFYINSKDFDENLKEIHEQGFIDALGFGINFDLKDEFLRALGDVLSVLINENSNKLWRI